MVYITEKSLTIEQVQTLVDYGFHVEFVVVSGPSLALWRVYGKAY